MLFLDLLRHPLHFSPARIRFLRRNAVEVDGFQPCFDRSSEPGPSVLRKGEDAVFEIEVMLYLPCDTGTRHNDLQQVDGIMMDTDNLVLEAIFPGADRATKEVSFEDLRKTATNGCPACSMLYKGIRSYENTDNVESVVFWSFRKGGTLSVVIWNKAGSISQQLEIYTHPGGKSLIPSVEDDIT